MRSRTKSEAFLFWLGVFVVSLLVMVKPAQASGTVSKTSYSYINLYPAPHFDTPALACAWVLSAYPGYPAAASVAVVGLTGTSFTCQFYNASGGGAGGYSGTIVGNVCPTNSTGTTTCTCTNPYIPNAGATACVMPTCPANGTNFSSGYYDIGTNPNSGSGLPPTVGCENNCQTGYNGDSVGWRVQVGGVYHYFAKGVFNYTGQTCAGGSPSVGATTAIPTASCAAGQTLVTGTNGFKKCYNDMTGTFVDGNSASAVAAAKTLADAATAAAIASAGSAVAAAGGSASDVAAAKSVAAGVAGAGAAQAAADPQAAFCQSNPDAALCKPQSVAADTGGALPSVGTGSWYVKTYPQGVSGVLTTNFNTMKATPLFGLINQLVPTLSGAAHTGCFSIEIWHVGASSLCIPPMVMQALGIFMILTALFAARAIIFGG